MPAISRQVGTVSSNVNVFIPNATVSTGAGLANIIASTVTLAWCRSDQAGVSSWTLTTVTLGTWTASTMVQASSSVALGWYQVSFPHGVFDTGDNAFVHLGGAPSMAPVPILIELTKTDNQTYTSSKVFSSTQVVLAQTNPGSVSTVTIPLGISTGVVSVSSATIPFGVSSVSTPVGVTTATAAVYEGVADALLLRNVSSGANTGRLVREAFYAIRNRVDLTAGVVYATDDTTSSWAFTTSTSAVDPIVEINPT